MDFKSIVEDNILIICGNDIKRKILSFLNEEKDIYNIKFMTINEVVKKLYPKKYKNIVIEAERNYLNGMKGD